MKFNLVACNFQSITKSKEDNITLTQLRVSYEFDYFCIVTHFTSFNSTIKPWAYKKHLSDMILDYSCLNLTHFLNTSRASWQLHAKLYGDNKQLGFVKRRKNIISTYVVILVSLCAVDDHSRWGFLSTAQYFTYFQILKILLSIRSLTFITNLCYFATKMYAHVHA